MLNIAPWGQTSDCIPLLKNRFTFILPTSELPALVCLFSCRTCLDFKHPV